jgi:ribosomal protein L3 glutamine methyltransferase
MIKWRSDSLVNVQKTEFLAGLAQLCTVVDLVRYGASSFVRAGLFFGHGADNAVDEAHELVLHGLALGRSSLGGNAIPPEFYSARVCEAERDVVGELLWRRIDERCPAAYLTQSAWFAGLEFYVDERVLVPRSPFAELIGMGFSPWMETESITRVLDVGTGSGCIAIACAYAMPWAEVVAVDIDAGARAVAQRNVESHGLQGQVSVVASDVLNGVDGHFDLIVSNPPYVPPSSIGQLPEEFMREPRLGLDGGADGLDIVRRLLSGATDMLNANGGLFVEVGESAEAFDEAFPALGHTWLDEALENGGEGLFFLSAGQLTP